MTESERDARDHIAKVEGYLSLCADLLRIRAITHDASKLEEPELSGYAGLSDALKGLEYGTPEYRAAFEPFKEVIKHHYAANDHHPEYHADGVNAMNLLQIIEMLCDWRAASQRSNGNFEDSITVSCKRFGIDAQLESILRNTASHLGWIEYR